MTTAAQRRAALTLHALAPEDRAWMLSQLSPEEREPLLALLDDLRSLGLPVDAHLVRSAIEATPAPPVATAAFEAAHAIRAAHLLQAEPAWLAAVLLQPCGTHERDRLLAAWPPQQASEVQRLMTAPWIEAPALRLAAQAALADRLARPPEAVAPRPGDLRTDDLRHAEPRPPRRRWASALGWARA